MAEISYGPAFCTAYDGGDDLFVVHGTTLWHQHYNSASGFSPWHNLGGVSTSAPAATAHGDTLHVFVCGGGGEIAWNTTRDNGATWSGWKKPGGNEYVLAGNGPAICHWDSYYMPLFWVNPSKQLMQKDYFEPSLQAARWGSLVTHGGVCTSTPAAVHPATGTLFAFVRGNDGLLYNRIKAVGGTRSVAELRRAALQTKG